MFSSVFRKTLYEKRWMLIAWCVGIFAMTLLTMWFYPFFKNTGFEEVINTAPKSIQGLLGQAANYKTVSGYVDQQIFALRIPMFTLIMAITLCVSLSVGDENRGTLETLLAQPVSRAQAYWQKFGAAAVILAIACLAVLLGVVASFPFIHGSMSIVKLLEATFACWLITMCFAALTFAVGMSTGGRGATIGIPSGIAFLTYLISSMAPAVQQLSTAQKLTPFYYYNVPTVALHGLKLTNMLVLTASIAVFCSVSLVIFLRRDLVRD